MLNTKEKTMKETPYDKGPRSSVPKSAKYHSDHEICVAAARTLLVATKGNIQVVAQPSREADVPATPELSGRSCKIRRLEVWHKVEAHPFGNAFGDRRITGEIPVDLESESIHPYKTFGTRQLGGFALKNRVGN